MLVQTLLLILCCTYNTQGADNSTCDYLIQYDYDKHCTGPKSLAPSLTKSSTCRNTTVCPLHPEIVIIETKPYSMFMRQQVERMISQCCGQCRPRVKKAQIEDVITNNSPYLSANSSADFIFPVFASRDVVRLYGRWFIPFVDVPAGTYIVREKSKPDVMNELLIGIAALWPLLVMLLLFALLAGFVAWIIEMWGNTEEFSRSFLQGLFDGFWWAYVSMTTVGYGDKSARSTIGRLFSVVWILIGITIFSMLTASLTNIITATGDLPNTDMLGKTIGVLKGRAYDQSLVTTHGGILNVVKSTGVIDGLDELFDNLFHPDPDKAQAFLVDDISLTYYIINGKLSDKREQQLEEIVPTKKIIEGDKLSYGMLVQEKSVYDHYKAYVRDNWFLLDSCRRNMLNNGMVNKTREDDSGGIFSTDGGLFYPTLIGVCVALVVALIIGFGYEIWNRKFTNKEVNPNVLPSPSAS